MGEAQTNAPTTKSNHFGVLVSAQTIFFSFLIQTATAFANIAEESAKLAMFQTNLSVDPRWSNDCASATMS